MTLAYLIPEAVLLALIIGLRSVGLGEGAPALLFGLYGILYGAVIGAGWSSIAAWRGTSQGSKLWSAVAGAIGALVGVAAYLVFGDSFFSMPEFSTGLHRYGLLYNPPIGVERDVIYISVICAVLALLAFKTAEN